MAHKLPSDYRCFALAGKEGLMVTYSIKMTYEKLVELVATADTNLPSTEKCQRDTQKSRVKSVCEYLTSREDTFFPSLILAVTKSKFEHLPISELYDVDTPEIQPGVLTLPIGEEALLVDGQGRYLGIKDAISIMKSLGKNVIDIKVITTNTNSIYEAKKMLRQIFSDLHRRVVKPNASNNLYFDSSEASSNFVNDVADKLDSFSGLISLEGKNTHAYKLSDVQKFVTAFTGLSIKEQNKTLTDERRSTFLISLANEYMLSIEKYVPDFNNLKNTCLKESKNTSIIPTAIWLESIGYLGNVLQSHALNTGSKIDFTVLEGLNKFDFSKDSKSLENKVIFDKKIVKGSSKKLAVMLSCHLGLPLPTDLALSI